MISAFILSVLNYKLAGILCAFAFIGIYIGSRSKKEWVKHLCFNGSAIVIAIAAFEGYLTKQDLKQSEFHIYEELVRDQDGRSHFQDDEQLGYGAVRQGRFVAQKKVKTTNEIVYHAQYTLEDGKRFTPSSEVGGQDCIHFFGCSYTFGHGLDDTATLPHYLGELTNRSFHVVNHGFDGYGLHQVMRQVEELAKDTDLCGGRKIAIYPHLLGHISRAAGYASWDRYGPHYELDEGVLKNLGPFENRSSIWVRYVDPFLIKSRIYKRFFKQYYKEINDADIERALAIILKCNRILAENEIEFEVFVYDIEEHIANDFGSQVRFEKAIEILEKANVKMHFLSDVISDYDENVDKYTISIHDRHPNALSNKLLASYFSSLYNQEQISFSTNQRRE